MSLQVPFRTDESIEREANALLQSYGLRVAPVDAPPVPVDEILENHLHITFELDDLCATLGKPDVLGALYIAEKKVVVDVQLDPSTHPDVLGRYRFTVGHEIGHWQLHRDHFLDLAGAPNLFSQASTVPPIICRESQRREPPEWQADRFSAALLMPRALVSQAWGECYGSLAPRVSADEYEMATGMRPSVLKPTGTPNVFEEFENNLFKRAARALAQAFEVSVEAMKIRLITLGFLVRNRALQLPLTGA